MAMSINEDLRVFALCTVGSGADILRLLSQKIRIETVIGLTERSPGSEVAGYLYMEPISRELGIKFVPVRTYGLSAEHDREVLGAQAIDLLLVLGWQRLIPRWLIERCRIGAVGIHGSAVGITGGRGRSPQNWALILGEPEFHLSIFAIDEGMDAGDILDSRSFEYGPCDDIETSYLKVAFLAAEMIEQGIDSGRILEQRAMPQSSEARYLPQRLPEDGAIDWSRPSVDLCRFVAALTRPYPGAFCESRHGRLTIWRARPLGIRAPDRRPGSVVLKRPGGAFVVASGDGCLLVDDYDIDGSKDALVEGDVLASVSFHDQMRSIVERHVARYPSLPLSAAILRAAGLSV